MVNKLELTDNKYLKLCTHKFSPSAHVVINRINNMPIRKVSLKKFLRFKIIQNIFPNYSPVKLRNQ